LHDANTIPRLDYDLLSSVVSDKDGARRDGFLRAPGNIGRAQGESAISSEQQVFAISTMFPTTSSQHSRQDIRSPERGQQVVPKQGPPTMSPRCLPDDGGPDDRRNARDGDKIGPDIRLPSCQPSEEEQAYLHLWESASACSILQCS
jgi:hypothetical protein